MPASSITWLPASYFLLPTSYLGACFLTYLLKVPASVLAPTCSLTYYSLTHSLTQLLTYLPTHLLTYSLAYLLTYKVLASAPAPPALAALTLQNQIMVAPSAALMTTRPHSLADQLVAIRQELHLPPATIVETLTAAELMCDGSVQQGITLIARADRLLSQIGLG